jgi:hypothetical protein
VVLSSKLFRFGGKLIIEYDRSSHKYEHIYAKVSARVCIGS